MAERHEEHPACKKISDEALAWLSRHLERGANDLLMVHLMALPPYIVSCFIKIQIGLNFLMPAYPGCPGKEAVKRVSVYFYYVLL